MTIHKRINYSKIAAMILKATAMSGGRMRLKTAVQDICVQMGLGLSNSAIMTALGAYCVEEVHDRVDDQGLVTRVVENWVVYG